ncbi:MAG: hypothetical protein K9N01_05545 [Cephaloticoccus sp.]|nr:hypothetical protein [Cephaloticoccus sp.]
MKRVAKFSWQRTARDGGRLRLGGVAVAEIRRLELINFRPEAKAEPLVGAEVGVPLYWRQYGNHQDPERSANSHRSIAGVVQGPGWLRLRTRGLTRSRSIESRYDVTFRVDVRGRITCLVEAQLEVMPGPGWLVTPHPDHGEVTFCTLWPAGVFSPDGSRPKRYQACLVQRGNAADRIEHHHLESPDKHHIQLAEGDRFVWGLESSNPVVTLGPDTAAEAGVCAYMWDTHLGLKICRANKPELLPPGTILRAVYILSEETKAELQLPFQRARVLSAGVALHTPMWVGGRHTFQKTFQSEVMDRNTAWPWQTVVIRGRAEQVSFARDLRIGSQDRCSLRIESRAKTLACWQATTLGPAFGEPAFRSGGKLRLRAMVRTRGLNGAVRVLLRIHRTGQGSVFAVEGYEVFASEAVTRANQDWTELTLTTPKLKPAPDRVHVLLQLEGRGTGWFDEVELTRLR